MVCWQCGKGFLAFNTNALTCSPACRKAKFKGVPVSVAGKSKAGRSRPAGRERSKAIPKRLGKARRREASRG